MIKIGINGAGGRMGLRIASLITQSKDCQVKLALERPGHPALGQDIGFLAGLSEKLNVLLTSDFPGKTVDVILDFSHPDATMPLLEKCQKYKIALLIGTTGFNETQIAQIRESGKTIPCLLSPNLSIGANVMFKTAAELARRLGPEYDIEIVETHHRFKKDAPRGTAKKLAAAVNSVFPGKNIPTHAIRVGDVVGEHKIIFGTIGERIELGHFAQTRDTFAYGAIKTGLWLAHAKPGFYTMDDILQ